MNWLLGALLVAPVLADVCHSRHFRELRGNEDDDYILYGLTQDCQVFFIRPPQLTLLSTLSVNIHSSYCSPNLVQLLVKSEDTLLILIKQAGNRICALEIQIPPAEMLFGDHLFSYSILASLSYASCSHSPNNEFSLDPDLSFLDSIYRNIVYFIDGSSVGQVWDVLQFLLTDEGHLQLLDKIPINNYAKNNWNGPDLANEYVLGLDAQRNYLFQRNRFEQSYVYACAFDSLFRPNKVSVHYANSTSRTYRTWLNSMSADGALLVFTETDQTIQPAVTRIFGQNISTVRRDLFCLGIANYAMDLGIIRTSTLRKMKTNQLPSLGETTTQRTTPVRKYGRMETTTMSNALWERGTTRRIVKVPKTTLKYTSVVYNTTEKMVTSTRFETTTGSYEEDKLYATTPDATPVALSTDSNDIGLMTSEERLLNNATLDALNQNRTSSTNLFSHTVSVLVLCSFI